MSDSTSTAAEMLALAALCEVRPSALANTKAVSYRRDDAGTVSITVPNDQCLVITQINAFSVDYTLGNTVAIFGNRSNYLRATPLEVLTGRPVLIVFGSGTADFHFAGTGGLPGGAPRFSVSGFRLPGSLLKKLLRLATEFGETA